MWLVNPITPNQIKTEQPEHFMISNANETSSTDLGIDATMDGRSLQGIPNEHLDEPDLRQNEVLAALQMSPNPAKFVLDLMLGTCSQHQKKGWTGFEESVLKIYVLMLEQLLQVSPLVQPNVKADALKLAIEWKAKMKLSAQNSIEIMGFLQFVAAFGLVSSFNRDEIFKLLGTAAQHQQARNVCRILGFTDMIPGKFTDSILCIFISLCDCVSAHKHIFFFCMCLYASVICISSFWALSLYCKLGLFSWFVY